MADSKGQITVVEQVYHQLLDGQPSLIESRFSRELESDEQLYQRRLKVDEEGAPLDCGWVKEASQLIIVSEEGRNLQVNPMDEEREELRRKVLEVYFARAFSGFCCLVPPGESMRICPVSLEGLCIRSQSGTIQFILYLLPR